MPDRLVICSSPEDDDYVGEHYNADFVNIGEYTFEDLGSILLKYKEVLLIHNSKNDDDFFLLNTFANLYNIENNILGPKGALNREINHSFYINSNIKKQIAKDQILFLGCSHTFGMGHSSPDTVYTHILSKMLGKHPLVDAHPGKGNWLTEEKLQTYNLRNTTLVIQFTDIFRVMLNGMHTRGHTFNRSYNQVFTDEVLASIFIEQVKRIVNLLQANNVKFAFFKISHTHPLESQIYSLLTKYKEFVFINDFNQDTGNLGHHFGVKSHTLWADKIVSSGLLS